MVFLRYLKTLSPAESAILRRTLYAIYVSLGFGAGSGITHLLTDPTQPPLVEEKTVQCMEVVDDPESISAIIQQYKNGEI